MRRGQGRVAHHTETQRRPNRLRLPLGRALDEVVFKLKHRDRHPAVQIGEGRSDAAAFTDFADLPDDLESGGELRLPGMLYRNGATILVGHDGHDIGRVVRMTLETPFHQLFQIPGGPRSRVACMVDVGVILREVYANLGVEYPPQPARLHYCGQPFPLGSCATQYASPAHPPANELTP